MIPGVRLPNFRPVPALSAPHDGRQIRLRTQIRLQREWLLLHREASWKPDACLQVVVYHLGYRAFGRVAHDLLLDGTILEK